MDAFRDLLDQQSGVISRGQARDCGLVPNDLRRMVRRRELVQVHPGVLVNHTGPLSWLQRAWAAVLAVAPAALSHESALRAYDGPGRRDHDDGSPIHVAVDRQRNVADPDGVRVHRMSNLGSRVLWLASPPRVRVEEAVIDVASGDGSDFKAIGTIADTVQARLTTAPRLLAALAQRQRIGRRAFLVDVLTDVAAGTCSVLEHGYLTRVERPHGLPTAERQLRASSRGPVYRDVAYDHYRQIVELDGRLVHNSAARRDADLDRDLDAAVERQHTVRIGWGQVFDRPCATAVRIAALLQARGWSGSPIPCPDCTVRSLGVTG
jgi:hypothetical protein